MSELLEFYIKRQQSLIDLVTALVNIESPSNNKAATDQLVDYVEGLLNDLNAEFTRYPQTEVGDFLLAKWNHDASGKPLMVMMHLDTVWPVGTLAERPVTIDDEGRLYGPGAVDMKGGVAVALSVIKGIQDRNDMPDHPIWFFFNSDEEIGSGHSAPMIEELAADCELVMVMEPGTSDGAIKTQRKGVSSYVVTVTGKSSHAGNEPEAGVNAIVDLAQQIIKLNSMNDLRNGTSVSVTMIDGGIAKNVIPDKATAKVDCRVLTQLAMDETKVNITGLTPFIPGAEVEVEISAARPPMEFNAQMQANYARAQEIGKQHGITVRGESVGGGSDGNITAAMGISTLDGLGPVGGGLHALHEHVRIKSMIERSALLHAIITEW